MTFIPKKIRLLPLSVALATTLSFGTSAFAASYTMTTTYIGDTKVSVTSQITNANANDQITFLVAKSPVPANPVVGVDIVYINQTPADASGNATFTFTTNYDYLKADSTILVKSGSMTSGVITAAIGTSDDIFSPAAQLTSKSARKMSDPNLPSFHIDPSLPGTNSLTTFGTITGVPVGVTTDTCGILFSADATSTAISKTFTLAELNALNGSSVSVKKFPAHVGNGTNSKHQFAIKLVNNIDSQSTAGILVSGNTYFTRTYATYLIGSTEVVTLGEVRTVVFN